MSPKIKISTPVKKSAFLLDRAGFLSAAKLRDMEREKLRGVVREIAPRRARTQVGVVQLRTFIREEHSSMRGRSATIGGSSPLHGHVALSSYVKVLDDFAGKNYKVRVKIVARYQDATQIECLSGFKRKYVGTKLWMQNSYLRTLVHEGTVEILSNFELRPFRRDFTEDDAMGLGSSTLWE